MDFYSKKIIGYTYSRTMTAELAVNPLKNACLNVQDPKGILLHSDLGTQYAKNLFESLIENS